MTSVEEEPSSAGWPEGQPANANGIGPLDQALSVADRFRDCGETSSDWFWEQDEELRFSWFFNVRAASDVHVADEGRGKTRWELVDRGVTEQQWAEHKADLAARRPFRDFRIERLGADGGIYHIAVSGRPFFDAAGTFKGYRGSCRDITDEVNAKKATVAALTAAEAANHAKSELLANMSHELRTPLNAIMGFSEIIRDGLDPVANARFAGYAGDIHTAGKHLLDVINNILDVATIESGRLELHEGMVDLADLIEEVEHMLSTQARSAGIELDQAIEPDLPYVRGDAVRLKQIMLNLCGNAIKFTASGGLVRIDARTGDDGGLEIAVSDTGIGMRASDIPKALEPFGQVEQSLARRFGGSGLGLPIAKALTEIHGGTLRIESEVGLGTTVTVSLPESRVRPNRRHIRASDLASGR